MLLHSTLPVSFWWMTWKTACYLQNRMPTVTVYGYMTPFENVRGAPPSLKRQRIWGCKAYVLKPKAARRKDFDDKAYSGFHAGYADDDRGYEIYIPELDKIVTSVHVLCNEVIPNPTDEYYRELQRLNVVTAEGPPRDPATYQYLVGLDHLDDEDGLTYKVTRIDKVKGYIIVAYRRLVTRRASDTREEMVPIHIADICRMTDDLVQSRKASAATPDGDSRPAMRNIPERPSQRTSTSSELDVDISPSRARVNTSGVSRSSPAQPPFRSRKSLAENISTGNRRVNPDRACKSPNIVYTLQEEGTTSVPDDIAPSSYRAALASNEAADWRKAIRSELQTLHHDRRCWRFVPYPPRGTRILRCHFVFKKKKHFGQVVRYKARLAVDGSGQRQGVN
jgi:hypothetical protein